ncbi:MAG: DUF1036 domain-containing protein [Phycisphaerae bacterium]
MLRITCLFLCGLILFAGVAHAGGPYLPVDLEAMRKALGKMDPGTVAVAQAQGTQRTAKPKVISVPGSTSGTTQAGGPAPPANDYEFCNRTSYQLLVAVGLKAGSLVVTRGWWPLNAGECKVFIKGPLTTNVYFSNARSSYIHLGPIRVWGGKHRLCAGKGMFQASSSEGQPCGPGHNLVDFARVDTGGKPGWRTTLTESDQIKTLEQARTAGLQRLLSDVGLFDGAIDGVSGPRLSEAIGKARSALGMTSSDTSQLHARLVAEANQMQQISGLTLCNRTQQILYAAYGRELNGKKASSGWYVLQPGVCEKVVTDPLSEPFVYAHAVAEKQEPEVPGGENWTGPHMFCTADGEFDYEGSMQCPGGANANTGFAQMATDGRPGVVYEFRSAAAPEPEPEPAN